MASYQKDREWSDLMLPHVQRIIGPFLLLPAPRRIDCEEATDLIILEGGIAARIRRDGFARRYPHDFTIRSLRDSGTKTEHEKILQGFAKWFFYGHATSDCADIYPWYLISLDVFRDEISSGRIAIPRDTPNGDGTYFKAYDIRKFPKHLRWHQSGLQQLAVAA